MITKYIVNNASAQTISGNLIVSVSGISGNANKVVKVKSDETGFDFIDIGYETISYAEAQALEQSQTGGTLTPGQWYRIESVDRNYNESVNFNTYGDIFLKAISSSRFSPDGYLLAINADYNGVGDYSDSAPYTNNVGVAYNGLSIDTTTDIIIWNNRHWFPTGLPNNPYTITQESEITTLCTPLGKDYTSRSGYIIESQKIIYDVISNTILRMEDKRGNVVNSNINDNNFTIDNFRFGDNYVTHNYIDTPQTCHILNYPNLIFAKNHMLNGTIVNPTPSLVDSGVTLSLQNNRINDLNFSNDLSLSMDIFNGIISDSKIIGQTNIILTSSTIELGDYWGYNVKLIQTGGTFNGIITAITINNQVVNYYTKHRITNNLNTNVIFQNSQFLKTYSGSSFTIKPNNIDNIEFKFVGGDVYQTDVNIYI